jgi:hypothetical protein
LKLKILLGLIVSVAVIAIQSATTLSAAAPVQPDQVIFTAAPSYLPLAWMRAEERFPDGAALYIKDSHGTRKLFPAFVATADANVSFDGNRILFAGKRRKADPWQIWESAFTDTSPRLVTSSANDAIRPFYLPGNRLAFSTKQNGRFVLINSSIDGSDQRQISFASENVIASDVLRDGRILVNSAYPGQNGSGPEIYAVYSDGSGFESIRCDHPPTRYFGRELESGNIVFTHGDKFAMFISPFATERSVSIPRANYDGDIAETSSHEWIVAATVNGRYVLRLWKPGNIATSTFASMPTENLIQPVAKRSRTVPKIHPSALHDWKYSNLLALNVYTSKLPLTPGSVARVRVYSKGIDGAEKLLGTSAVEADGSFFVRVPGDQPIQFELVDSTGNTLQREKGWFWSRSGEQRICVGCHAGPERAPDNVAPMVLEKSTEPVDMTQSFSKRMGEQ